jgi:cytochrome P450
MLNERVSGDVCLPPGPAWPRAVQGALFLTMRRRWMRQARQRYGTAFTVNIPLFGRAVVISDPALVKQLFLTSTEVAGNPQPNLGVMLGPGSMFSLDGEEHRRRRKLLVPPFHGRRMQAYESIIEEEVLREAATWPEGQEFETLPPMMRITLNVILRAVFGAEGAEFEELRELLPRWVELASRLVALPFAAAGRGRWSPGARLAALRARYDEIIDAMITRTLADPGLGQRSDVLALMLQARYDDGEPMSRGHVADELLTLLGAGHETTATTLSWAVERLRRHPHLLGRLAAEADAGGSELRQATILEVQRTRPVIDATARKVKARMRLGEWVIPEGYTVLVGIGLVHSDDAVFARAAAFDPDRFAGASPDSYSWIPFGGGTRRCIGAAFAGMEMNVTLRTLLREFELAPTRQPGERWHFRGVAYGPARGGRAVMYRRNRAVAGAGGREAAAARA